MVATDHHRRGELAAAHHVVEAQPGEVALPGAEPADTRGESLEMHALAGGADPSMQPLVIGKQFEHRGVGARDVVRIAAQRDPPEWSPALAELVADVYGDEPRIRERIGEAAEARLVAQ